MIDKRVYSLTCSRWIDLVVGRPWSDLVAAKKHSKKLAGIKKRKNSGKFVTKLVEKLTFAFSI